MEDHIKKRRKKIAIKENRIYRTREDTNPAHIHTDIVMYPKNANIPSTILQGKDGWENSHTYPLITNDLICE